MGFTYRAVVPLAAAAVLAPVSGCSRTQQDWRAAQRAGTAHAYEVFVRRHPGSELSGVARQRITQLTEEAAWQQATLANTAAAYQAYLTRYPTGSWSQDARIRMESRSLPEQGAGPMMPGAPASVATPDRPGHAASGASNAATSNAATSDRATSNAAYDAARTRSIASETPSSRVTPAADSAAGYGVQLGAFSSTANAHRQWQQLSAEFGPQLRGLTAQVVPVTSSGRRLYRLEARVATEAAARRLCRQLQQHSRGCLPLP